jgi:hypothetical protein
MGNVILSVYLFASITPHNNSMGSLNIYYKSAPAAFSRIPFQCYMLSNDTSTPTFKAISHE